MRRKDNGAEGWRLGAPREQSSCLRQCWEPTSTLKTVNFTHIHALNWPFLLEANKRYLVKLQNYWM